MIISPFTPLHFPEANLSDGLESRYVQTFAQTDQIMLQLFISDGEEEPSGSLNDASTGKVLGTIEWGSWAMSDTKTLLFHVYKGLSDGYYTVTIGDKTSDVFRVTSEKGALARTSLIQYRFKDNKQRDDVVSLINLVPRFFDFRVPGGFKDSGWGFGVSNEQFSTQHEDIVELYATDYTTKTFTLGNSMGVPVWYGEMLNRLLTCNYVYVDGQRYARNDTEVPNLNSLIEGLDSFVFTQVLRKIQVLDPKIEAANQIAIRRVDEDTNRLVDTDTNRLIL